MGVSAKKVDFTAAAVAVPLAQALTCGDTYIARIEKSQDNHGVIETMELICSDSLRCCQALRSSLL